MAIVPVFQAMVAKTARTDSRSDIEVGAVSGCTNSVDVSVLSAHFPGRSGDREAFAEGDRRWNAQ